MKTEFWYTVNETMADDEIQLQMATLECYQTFTSTPNLIWSAKEP